MKKRAGNLVFLSVVLIIVSLVSSTNTTFKAIPYAYAQTNAAILATFEANDNIVNSAVTNKTTVDTNEGLEIKKQVKYFDGASGYLVYPSTAATTADKKVPAVIMIHEFWGINDNIRSMANTLAKQGGYIVLAVDLFKGQSTKDPNQAMQLVQSARSNPQEAISNLQAAVKYVRSLPFVNSSKIASIGWCFGGGQSLQLGFHSEELQKQQQQQQQQPLAATILYYGTPLVTDKAELSKIKWPVLGIFGDHDQAITLQEIEKFKAALDD